MSEHQKITTISVLTDTEFGYEKIGDIDGGYIDPDWLESHISKHGTEGLFEVTAYINYQVFDALRRVNQKKSQSDNSVKEAVTSN